MTACVAQEPVWAWGPQAGPQSDAIACAEWCEELFYGGAVFGGKSDFLLGDFIQDLHQGRDWTGILFRQTLPELEDLIERSMQIYPYTAGEYLVGRHTWRWPTGALLRLRHLDEEADFQRYMGHSYSWIGWDELPNWRSMAPYRQMLSRLRGPATSKRVRGTGNPGGRCHAEIRDYWQIGEHPEGRRLITDEHSKMRRMFIPARVTDNTIGLQRDPGYLARLAAVGDPELVRAWRDGDWNAIIGAYFSQFSLGKHVVEPFEVPEGWAVFTGGDYGEHNPCWWGIVAVDFDDDVWIVDEYHRAEAGGADHARGVRAMLDNCPYLANVTPRLHLAPHDMWTKRRPGEASQALAPKDSFASEHIYLTRANMERVNGWRNLKDLLYAGRVNFFRGRTERVIDSLSTVARDIHNPEDVEKGGNDHPADGLRYIVNHVYRPRKRVEVDRSPGTGLNVLEMLRAMNRPMRRYA